MAEKQDVTKRGFFALKAGKVPGTYKLHAAKDRVTFTSDEVAGELACKAVIYIRKTPTIEIGQGYLVTGSNSGRDLARAAKMTFPAQLVKLCEGLRP